jgi:hypothetical protein
MCKTKVVNQNDNKREINYTTNKQSENTDREEYAFVVESSSVKDSGFIDAKVLRHFRMDSGSTCNVIDRSCKGNGQEH